MTTPSDAHPVTAAGVDVLVLDDFRRKPMTNTERRELLEVIEDRYDRTPPSSRAKCRRKLGTTLNDPTIADAICASCTTLT
jgi:DNA replication protein DnaC